MECLVEIGKPYDANRKKSSNLRMAMKWQSGWFEITEFECFLQGRMHRTGVWRDVGWCTTVKATDHGSRSAMATPLEW
jgi:hypothetical protein